MNFNLLAPFVRSVLGIPSVSTIAMIGAGVGALVLAAGSGYAGYRLASQLDQGRYVALQYADAKALADGELKVATQQKAYDDAAINAAVHEGEAQQKIAVRTVTITKEIPTYVTAQQDRVACVSYGLVRVLDAAVLGVDPASLPLPPDVTDDTCTALKASDLAASIADNYGTAEANAEQLDALEALLGGN